MSINDHVFFSCVYINKRKSLENMFAKICLLKLISSINKFIMMNSLNDQIDWLTYFNELV